MKTAITLTPTQIRAEFDLRDEFIYGRVANFVRQLCLERGIYVRKAVTNRHLEQLWKQAKLPAGDLYGKYTSRQIMVMLDPDVPVIT